MAKVFLNPGIRRLQGKLGDWVFRRNHNGTLSVTKVPDMSNVKWSPAQKEHRERFGQAVADAKRALADLAVSDCYHGRTQKSSAFLSRKHG